MNYNKGLFLIFVLTILISTSSITGQDEVIEYNETILIDDFIIGIRTNAPLENDPFTYVYQESLEVQLDFFDFSSNNTIMSSIFVSIRSSIIGDRGELAIDISTNHYTTDFQSGVSGIVIGASLIKITDDSLEQEIFEFIPNERNAISINLKAAFGNLQPLQFIEIGSITFSNFVPKTYEIGFIEFETWLDNFIPLSSMDVIVLPLAALGATLHVINQDVSSFKKKSEKKIDQISDIVDENENIIDGVRIGKEAAEFTSDTVSINQAITKDHDEKWLSKVGKVLISVYIVLLITNIIFFYTNNGSFPFVNEIYLYYTAIVLLLALSYALITFLSSNITKYLGTLVPVVHPLFGILSIIVFIFIPFTYLRNKILIEDISIVRDLLFLSLISTGFIITALFAGYYLARSGISWAKMFDTILKKVKIPKRIINFVIKAFTFIFFLIVIVKLTKTLSLIVTILIDSQYSSNAYLVSLAASYLNEEMAGPTLISYGLILIFFLQTIMAIFLHIRYNDIKNQDSNEVEGLYRVMKIYRRFSVFLVLTTLSFLHLILILNGNLSNLGINQEIMTNESINTIDVWNVFFTIPPFRILLDILLAVGLIIALPFSIYQMWKLTSENGN